MKYNNLFLVFLTFFSGISIFTNAAAIFTSNSQSCNNLALRVPPAPKVPQPKVQPGNGGKGDTPQNPGSSSGNKPLLGASEGGRAIPGQGNLKAFQLKRVNSGNGDAGPSWMKGYADIEKGWESFTIVRDVRRGVKVVDYSIHKTDQVYFTKFVDRGDPAFTSMKYRDIILDSYKAETGGKTNPRLIATDDIKNPAAKAHFVQAFKAQGKESNVAESIEFHPTSPGYVELIAKSEKITEPGNPLR